MDPKTAIDFIWILLAAFLVFSMHAGFTLVEVGFTRAKNSVNIIMKNFMTVVLGLLIYFFVGYGLMFGTSAGGFIGTDNFILKLTGSSDTRNFAVWLFQAVFAATAATIVSGAMAERTIKAIKKGAYTGNIGDGKIFVLDLPRCIRIRTGEEGTEAIG